jgi:hypothetical protein
MAIKSYLKGITASFAFIIFSLEIGYGQPRFSIEHGFFEAPFSLTITASDPLSVVYYTTDGSAPDHTNGSMYSLPLIIDTTTILRAAEVKNGTISSMITTRTYLFLDDVIRQPYTIKGYPSKWGKYTGITGTAIADYEMDPEMMADPVFASSVKAALLDIPTISLVTNKGYFFSSSTDPDTGGIYIHTGPPLTNTTNGTGFGWERPGSFEIFDSKDSVSLQADCGIRIEGGHSRRAEKTPKHSFRLVFRSEYGTSKLYYPLFGDDAESEINTFVLRAGFGNTWVHWSYSERAMAQYLRDRWTKDSHMQMGYHGSQGFYAHLYINGIYWGVYNPSERLDKDFAESYLTGNEEDFDIIKDYAEVADGIDTSWNLMMSMANAGLSGEQAYQKLQGNLPGGTPDPNAEALVDVVNLADYMLLNFYGGNWDWDHHNWVAIRNRVEPGKGFQFYSWDAEHMLETVEANILTENNINCPSRIFQQLLQNQSFRRLFADRIQKHCFNNGALTPESGAQRWIERASQIDEAVIAESARWGDYRRDVHRWQTAPYELYTRETFWLPEMDFMLNTYFPNRTSAFIASLRSAGLFPDMDAPVFWINGDSVISNRIETGDNLAITSSAGEVYYTLDGSDPVYWTSAPVPSPAAVSYNGPVILNHSAHIKARTFLNGRWSAVNEQFFIIPENYNDLKITEIHYNPINQGIVESRDLEFIEIKNTGNSVLSLGGLRFAEGIEYEFPQDAQLKSGQFIVLATNRRHFYDLYGFFPYDIFDGQLDNNGEKITLVGTDSDTICSFRYENSNGWPAAADGEGNSLVPTECNPQNMQNLAEYWRASYLEGGSPGKDDLLVLEGRTSDILTIYPNYPNPFSASTNISYKLLADAHISIDILNSAGQFIMRLEDEDKPAGLYDVDWKGITRKNSPAQGIYFYRITAKSSTNTCIMTNKMILIR